MVRHRRQLTPSTLPPAEAVRIILFGLDCAFTSAFLQTLLDAGVAISAIILPGPPTTPVPIRASLQRKSIMMGTSGNHPAGILTITEEARIPVWRVGTLQSQRALQMLASFQAELLVCACFNRKIPARLYKSFRLGGVNVHPSLLPDKRGPDPQFWTLKDGTGQTGVSVHRLSPQFDSGPILAQTACSYPDGISETDLDALTARAGARMLTDLLPDMSKGMAPETEQDHARATYAPIPAEDDFRLVRDRPARAAYNFVRGVGGRGVPILLDWQGREHRVLDALHYSSSPISSTKDDDAVRWVQFTPGWALLRLATVGD